MRRYITIILLVLLLSAAWEIFPQLFDREKEYEQKLSGLYEFVQKSIEESLAEDLQSRVLYSPPLRPQEPTNAWTVSGVVGTRDPFGNQSYGRFTGIVQNVCRSYSEQRCWRMEQLTLAAIEPLDQMFTTDTSSRRQSDTTLQPAEEVIASDDEPESPPTAAPLTETANAKPAALGAELEAARQRSESLSATTETSSAEASPLSEQPTATRPAELSGERQEQSPKITELIAKGEIFQEWVNVLSAERDVLSSQVSKLSVGREKISSDISQLSAQLEGLLSRVEELSEGELSEETNSLYSFLTKLTVEREALSSQLAVAVENRETLAVQIAELTANKEELTEELEAASQLEADEAVSLMQREVEAAGAKIPNLGVADAMGGAADVPDLVAAQSTQPLSKSSTDQLIANFAILQFVLASDVVNREPVGITDTFLPVNDRAYAFARIKYKGPPIQVSFVWYHGDAQVSIFEATVGTSSAWRTWSSQELLPGSWRVQMVTEDGQIIAERAFIAE